MIPVRPGDRGPAVEDIQRRLRTLGYDLGRAGIDGIFMGATSEAVRSFQRELGLTEDGYVGDATWSALVDATFRLGDRVLYLRVPHFHGQDVRVLQGALNVLGFACGADGIFGPFTERAVREFQTNSGLPSDGIAGAETVGALTALRHVWEGKDPKSHSAARVAPARPSEVLTRVALAVAGLDEAGSLVAGRIVNLALATSEQSRVSLIEGRSGAPGGTSLVIRLCAVGSLVSSAGVPVVRTSPDLLAARLITAVSAAQCAVPEVVIELEDGVVGDEREEQRAAIAVLDAVCLAFE